MICFSISLFIFGLSWEEQSSFHQSTLINLQLIYREKSYRAGYLFSVQWILVSFPFSLMNSFSKFSEQLMYLFQQIVCLQKYTSSQKSLPGKFPWDILWPLNPLCKQGHNKAHSYFAPCCSPSSLTIKYWHLAKHLHF